MRTISIRKLIRKIADESGSKAGALKRPVLRLMRSVWPALGLKAVLDTISTPILVVNANSLVTYANDAAREMLAAYDENFRSIWPEFTQQEIVGTLIESPVDTTGLPLGTEISLGSSRLLIRTTAILDDQGNYTGSVLEWAHVPESRNLARSCGDSVEDAGVAGQRSDFRDDMRKIQESAKTIKASSERLEGISQQLVSHAEATAGETEEISAASDEVSGSVAIMEAGGAKMIASIREISQNSSESARVAETAVAMADSANQTISKLRASSLEIGKVISVITSIAKQTNLLALNASIEAARAGDAGRGFAVVAREVKDLSKETAQATSEVAAQIEAIQSDTKGAVHAIGEIVSIVNQISELVNSIAVAIEAQTATTKQMGRNVKGASRGASDIASHISGVALAAQNTNLGANETLEGAKGLAALAAEMEELIARLHL